MAIFDIFKSKSKKALPLGEIGSSGINRSGGQIFDEELNAALSNGSWFNIASKMYATEAAVSSSYKFITAPVKIANWSFEYPDGATPDSEVLEFCNDIWRKSEKTWQQTLSQICFYLMWGVFPFEICWFIDKATGTVWLRKLAPRKPSAWNKWEFDVNGTPTAYIQRAPSGVNGQWNDVKIPADKMVVFKNDDFLDNNQNGISICRSAYRSFKMKEEILISDRARLHRFGSPIPVFTEPPDELSKTREQRESNRATVEEIIYQLRSGRYPYIILPALWTMTLATPEAGSSDLITSAEYHDGQMFISMLAQAMGMGSSMTSTQGLGGTFKDTASLGPASYAKYIGETLDNNVFHPLIRMNFGEQKYYPCWKASNVNGYGIADVLPYVSSATQQGGLTHNYGLEGWIRNISGIPPITKEEYEEKNMAPKAEEKPRRGNLRAMLSPKESQINVKPMNEEMEKE